MRTLAVPAGVAAGVLGAALLLTACGVPVDSSPQPLAAGDIPLGLTAGTTTSSTELGPRTPNPAALIQVYYVTADRLVARARLIPSPATVTTAMGALLAGPTAAEAQAGIRSTIPSATQLLDARVSSRTAVLDLSANFAGSGGPDQILAIAQVVDTMTSLPGVTAVLFELAGQPVDVPNANGTLVTGPVSGTDYAALLAPGQQVPGSAGGT